MEINNSDDNHKLEIETFPSKPESIEGKKTWLSFFVSMAFFVGAFSLFLGWNLQLIFIILIVLLIHELGHYLAMRYFGYTNLSIFFVPLAGAVASGTKEQTTQKQELIVLLAGPLPGIVIGIIMYIYAVEIPNELLRQVGNVFIMLNVFNLLPIMPLDGGQIIRKLFLKNNEIITQIFIAISIVLMTIISIKLNSYRLLIIPAFLLLQLGSKRRLSKLKSVIENKGISLNKSYNELSDRDYWLIRDEIAQSNPALKKYIHAKDYTISDKENLVINEIKSLIQKSSIEDLSILGKLFYTITWLAFMIFPYIILELYMIKQ